MMMERWFNHTVGEEGRKTETARKVGKAKEKCSVDFKVLVRAENRGTIEEASNGSDFTLLTRADVRTKRQCMSVSSLQASD